MYHFSAVCPEFQMKKYGETLEKCGISSVFEAVEPRCPLHPGNADARHPGRTVLRRVSGEGSGKRSRAKLAPQAGRAGVEGLAK